MIYRELLIWCSSVLMLAAAMGGAAANADIARAQSTSKPRLLVLTDMSSIESGVREPDDAQSMIRLMLYANEFDIEGLIASSSLRHGQVVRPQLIREIVDAYGKDRPNLARNAPGYPTAAQLRRVIKGGQPRADEDVPVYQSVGEDKDTPASEWIIHVVDAPDPRPVWIVIWGGPADLAQALWKIRKTRPREAVAAFVSKIRVVASGLQDTTGAWIRSRYPNLFYAIRTKGGRGMYRGGDQTLVSSQWVQRNIRDHGALGRIYPDYHGGDIWWKELGKINGIKGGDSSSYMGLIRNGLNVQDHLTWENWGGRLEQDAENPHHYHDAIDAFGSYQTDVSPYLAAVYRWRPAFQAAYAARFDWCVRPYDQANHAPVNQNKTAVIRRSVASGQNIILSSGQWRDPDGDALSFHWQMLEAESSYADEINIEDASSRSARFTAPIVNHPQTIHMLLTTTDNGSPALSSYQRVHFTVRPQ